MKVLNLRTVAPATYARPRSPWQGGEEAGMRQWTGLGLTFELTLQGPILHELKHQRHVLAATAEARKLDKVAVVHS